MRCQRVRISISVWFSMCPMCSDPVTLGGGITIENTGPGALASARNNSSFTQNSAQRGSICCGSYALAISRGIWPNTPTLYSGEDLRFSTPCGPFYRQGNLRLYEGEAERSIHRKTRVADQCGTALHDGVTGCVTQGTRRSRPISVKLPC